MLRADGEFGSWSVGAPEGIQVRPAPAAKCISSENTPGACGHDCREGAWTRGASVSWTCVRTPFVTWLSQAPTLTGGCAGSFGISVNSGPMLSCSFSLATVSSQCMVT